MGKSLLAWLAVTAAAFGTAIACLQPKSPADAEEGASTGAPVANVNCSAVHASIEPDLVGLEASERAMLDTRREGGVAVVRYRGRGCDVQLDVLPSCVAAGEYVFSPYSATESRIARTASEVYDHFPLAASRLSGRVTDDRGLRVDVMLAGVVAIKTPTIYRPEQLTGDCRGATHVVSKIYLGGFAMAAGSARALEARASLFHSASDAGDTVILQREGSATACEEAQEKGVESKACDVPLRIALLPIPVPCDADAGPCGSVAEPLGDASAPVSASTGDGGAETAAGAMVHVPGGTFTMGARARADAKNDPARRTVTVDAFDLDANEVTAGEYETCVEDDLCPVGIVDQPTCNYGHADRSNHPMNCVDWNQASAYCHARGKRLPTEEEWEYASRGGAEERTYPWGGAEPARQLCWSGIAKRDGTCPVRTFAAGAYGLYDMAGNVSEWTSSPFSADRRDTRVYRGGGWSDARALDFRGAYRDAHAPSNKDSDLGFRCAR
jgi:formylglycine-generating enzyme required for sulfatase activity